METYLTNIEVAKILRLKSPRCVNRLNITKYFVGGRNLYKPIDVEKYVESKSVPDVKEDPETKDYINIIVRKENLDRMPHSIQAPIRKKGGGNN